jgi:excisionase family DNA binding protein
MLIAQRRTINASDMDRDKLRESDSISPQAAVRRSARVSVVAQLLDCDDSRVRRLIKTGALEAHRVGKRGVRVFLDSVSGYQEARSHYVPQQKELARKRRSTRRASHVAALSTLRERGLL